jgi:nucleoside-diphosphate-sugar epimerase
VVHLAAVPDPEASWERLLPANVVGVYQVARAAVSCGVRRLVLASSLHVVSAVFDQTQVRVGDSPRPGNLYGVTKAWTEALGAWVYHADIGGGPAYRLFRPSASGCCHRANLRAVRVAKPA